MTDQQPWAQPAQRRPGFWRQLWGMPWPLRALLGALLAFVLVLVVVAVVNGPSHDGSGITKAQYDQWRAECEARATETLDTSLYRVGGNQWVDEVNRCLTAKAND